MSGLARDPDRFRCRINHIGVTDIVFCGRVARFPARHLKPD